MMGWTASERHQRAKMVVVEPYLKGSRPWASLFGNCRLSRGLVSGSGEEGVSGSRSRRVIHMPDREAACSCGQLQVTVRGDPIRVAMCHCLECQRRTGSIFGVQAFYLREQVRLAKGIAKRYARRADSGRTVTFNFCPECGGTVFFGNPSNAPELIAVAVGMFADPDFEKPRHSVWEKRQHPWTTAIAEQQIEHSD